MLKVLIIDDGPVEHIMTGALLRSLGCEVLDATSGAEGVRMALALQPQLILLDMIMPEQDGRQTCMQLRANHFSGSILLTSGLFDKDVADAVEQLGADGFIAKPLRKDGLLRQLQQLGLIQ